MAATTWLAPRLKNVGKIMAMSGLVNRLSANTTLRVAPLVACCMFGWALAVAQTASPAVKLPSMDAPLKESYFPTAAAKRGIQGRVLVEFNITRRGKVDEVTILEADPEKVFDSSVRDALRDVRFTVPADWESSGAASHRFRLSYVFKIYPCPEPCKAPTPHESADDSMVISVQAGK
jgi:TonB family protein